MKTAINVVSVLLLALGLGACSASHDGGTEKDAPEIEINRAEEVAESTQQEVDKHYVGLSRQAYDNLRYQVRNFQFERSDDGNHINITLISKPSIRGGNYGDCHFESVPTNKEQSWMPGVGQYNKERNCNQLSVNVTTVGKELHLITFDEISSENLQLKVLLKYVSVKTKAVPANKDHRSQVMADHLNNRDFVVEAMHVFWPSEIKYTFVRDRMTMQSADKEIQITRSSGSNVLLKDALKDSPLYFQAQSDSIPVGEYHLGIRQIPQLEKKIKVRSAEAEFNGTNFVVNTEEILSRSFTIKANKKGVAAHLKFQ